MFKKRFIKKTMKRLVSLLLVLTVMIGLFVPFDLSVFAEEEAATGNSIYAMLYKYVNNQYELVIQNGNDVDPNKELVKSYSGFADTVNTQKESWIAPWKDERKGIKRVTIRDKIAPKSIDGWFYEMTQLKSSELLHLENLDTSSCEYMRYTFSKSGLEKLDLRSFDVSKVKSAYATFFVCSSLTDLNISNWTLSNVGSDGSGNMESFLQATGLETIDLSSLNLQRCLNLRSMLKGNTKLKNIIFGEVFTVGELTEQTNPQVSLYQMFEGCTALETLDLSSWNVYYCQDCTNMFLNCSALTDVNFDGGTWSSVSGNAIYPNAFEGCTSLVTLKPSFMTSYLFSPSIFKGCESLKELDLSSVGTDENIRPGFKYSDLSNKATIFEGCDELTIVTLSAGWPSKTGYAGTSIPVKGTWKKVAMAEIPQSDEVEVGTVLTNDELFGKFQEKYAGKWAAESTITFKGNGGSPNYQTIKGVKGDSISIDPDTLPVERNGYDFDGWYKTKDPQDGEEKLKTGDVIDAWNYYARWTPHHYTLKLNGNGGKDKNNNGEFVADASLDYNKFYELSNTAFSRDGYVLTSWNTRPNGTGDSYAPNDSVCMLTETQNGEVTLYAQWYKPDVIISFSSHGGTAVGDKTYTIGSGTTVTYGDLGESYRFPDENSENGYTFLGWFTGETGGSQITSSTPVTVSCTLHAHWAKNISATFNTNGGCFDNNPQKISTTKICKYNGKLGVLPEPEHDSASFMGWYTAVSGGDKITSNTVIKADTNYYAHWGFAPKFETFGGSYTSYPSDGYPMQETASYTISTLPSSS